MTEMISVQMNVNGQEVQARVPPDINLMQFLRDWLGLTGTKNGCSSGHCGACTVILNGKVKRACLVKMSNANSGQVETIEGLAKDGQLHPLQYTFVTQGAVQCGFCTPGMIMAAKALLDGNPQPSINDIKKALKDNRNLCRCTGYLNIFKAIQAAAEMLQKGEQSGTIMPEREHVTSTPS